MEKEKFKCAACGGVFEKIWTDEEALAELKENFGDISTKECNLICDGCYKKALKRWKKDNEKKERTQAYNRNGA
jgi:hypothetical protein